MTSREGDILRRVEAWYGVAIPSTLARLAFWYDGRADRAEAFSDRFSWELRIPPELFTAAEQPHTALRLPTSATDPVELLPVFGGYTRYGFLDLAPELGSREALSMVVSEPDSYDLPVYVFGPTLAQALSFFATPEVHEPDLREVFEFPIEAKPCPNICEEYYPRSIPTGYRYERTGVQGGVLAPRDAFDGGPPIVIDETTREFRSLIARAERGFIDGYPATTVLIARQFRAAYHSLGYFETDDHPHLMTLWAKAAVMLGRPSHAAIVLAIRDHPEVERGTKEVR